jgi:hypothetical protein
MKRLGSRGCDDSRYATKQNIIAKNNCNIKCTRSYLHSKGNFIVKMKHSKNISVNDLEYINQCSRIQILLIK